MKQVKILNFWQSTVWFIAILYLSFAPKQSFSTSLELFPHQDKVIHISMYVILTLLFLKNMQTIRFVSIKNLWLIGFLIISTSLAIEILQPILSNRSSEFLDLVSNSVGVFTGSWLFLKILRINNSHF